MFIRRRTLVDPPVLILLALGLFMGCDPNGSPSGKDADVFGAVPERTCFPNCPIGSGSWRDNTPLAVYERAYSNNCYGRIDHQTLNVETTTPGLTHEGEQWYVPRYADNSAVTQLFYEYSYSICDHMDSPTSNEGGYSTQGTLNAVWNQQGQGMCAINRWYNPSDYDHLTGDCGENPSGYQLDFTMGYGYPRYGNTGLYKQLISGTNMYAWQNLAAGAIVDELWWTDPNGHNWQFVNSYDYGREIQSSIFFSSDGTDNPTEGGDGFGYPNTHRNVYSGRWHGSPVVFSNVNGASVDTEVVPLQWQPDDCNGTSGDWYCNYNGQPGGDNDHPIMWAGYLGKTMTLNYQGRAHLIQWTTKMYVPVPHTYMNMEEVTAYVTNQFYRSYIFDVSSNTATELTNTFANDTCHDPDEWNVPELQPAAGGAIFSNFDQSAALGVYQRASLAPFGNKFGFCVGGQTVCTPTNPDDCKYNDDSYKFNVLARPSNGISSGWHYFTLYFAVGTLADVENEFRWLYQQGM